MSNDTSRRTSIEYLGLWLKGVAMGAADVVPGVSGGTIAFISGIYAELIDSLKNIGPQSLHTLFTRGWRAFWAEINGTFLAVLFTGVLTSVLTLAKLVKHMLDTSPILMWSLFFGLVLASIAHMLRAIKDWRVLDIFFLVIGAAVAGSITISGAAQLPTGYGYIFGAGMLAICAMILPGISGSFILLILGLYPTVIAAIADLNFVLLAVFGAGCILGLLCFSRFLSWSLHHHQRPTLALLIGFLVGSLNTLWPWKFTVESTVNRHGQVVPLLQENLLPWLWSDLTSQNHQLVPASALCIVGIFLVIGFDIVSNKKKDT